MYGDKGKLRVIRYKWTARSHKARKSPSHYMVTSNKGDQELLYAAPMQSKCFAIPESPVSLTVGGSPIPGGDTSINQFKDVFIKIQLGRSTSTYFVGLFVSCCCISHEEHLADVKVQFALSFVFYRVFKRGDFCIPFIMSLVGYLIFALIDKNKLHRPSEARPQMARLLVTVGVLFMLGGFIGGIVCLSSLVTENHETLTSIPQGILVMCHGAPIGWAAFLQNTFVALSAVLLWRVQRKPEGEYNLTI